MFDSAHLCGIFQNFLVNAEYIEGLPYGCGHINETYAVRATENGQPVRYILQCMNPTIFQSPERLMDNIARVTAHIRAKLVAEGGDLQRGVLTIVPTRDGKLMYTDDDGNNWRVYVFIEDAVSYQSIENPQDFYAAAKAFGHFQKQLADFDAASLFEVIPNFHNTRARFETFEEVLEEDIKGRAEEVLREIEFIQARKKPMSRLVKMLEEGELPLRVTHNDTKLNNVMIDEKTGEGICIIDLDTVMPGLSLYDFGDSIRFGASTAAEDETDLSLVTMDLNLFEVYVKGFLEEVGASLTEKEIEMLPWGAFTMTLECGMRFLTDYLQGDTYFRIHYPDQNLDRCRTQLKLVADMEEKMGEMEEIVRRVASTLPTT